MYGNRPESPRPCTETDESRARREARGTEKRTRPVGDLAPRRPARVPLDPPFILHATFVAFIDVVVSPERALHSADKPKVMFTFFTITINIRSAVASAREDADGLVVELEALVEPQLRPLSHGRLLARLV